LNHKGTKEGSFKGSFFHYSCCTKRVKYSIETPGSK
jgi:hypothetical protein